MISYPKSTVYSIASEYALQKKKGQICTQDRSRTIIGRTVELVDTVEKGTYDDDDDISTLFSFN